MPRIRALAAAFAFVAACSQSKQDVSNTTTQTPSAPPGSIVGVVTSMRTGAPLAGVVVSVPQANGIVSDTTDANGAYGLAGLTAGATYAVRFAAGGYVTRTGAATVPDSAGNYPSVGIAQLDMPLAQANATLSGHVTARDGAPAAGVVVTADLRSLGYELVASATTDAQGAYALTGLPGAPTGLTFQAVTQPWDANGDGIADYGALAKAATTFPGAQSLVDFDLRLAAADLLLLTSDLETGLHPANTALTLTFNRALDPAVTTVQLYDSSAARWVAVTTALDATGKVLSVTPAGGAQLAAYHAYTLTVGAVATNGDGLTVTRSFVADVPVTLLPPVAGLAVTPASADYDTATYGLSWTASAGATAYEVWVRDTSRNPSWIRIATPGSAPAPSVTVTLPSTFDYYSADGLQTPLAFGVAVDFAVVAVNAAGDAPSPTTATPVRRADTVAPTALTTQSGQADNSAGATARTISLNVTFDEYMDPGYAPTITLPTGLTATWSWNAAHTGGAFQITIPAATNGSGAFTIAAARDTSGNAMNVKNGTLTAIVQLVTNGGFESGDLTGWSVAHTGTATDPQLTTTAATGTWGIWLGNAAGTTQSGASQVYSGTITLPTGYSSIVASVSYRPYTTYPYFGYDTSTCVIQNAAGTSTLATLFSTYSNSSVFSSSSVTITGLAGQAVRILCQTNQWGYSFSQTGVYVDNLSILATP